MNNGTREKAKSVKLVIIGGGYAGLSALISLRKQAPDAKITLIDPRPCHLIITRLHETVRHSLEKFQIPYSHLANALTLFINGKKSCSMKGSLESGNRKKPFSLTRKASPLIFLLITTGALPIESKTEPNVYDLNAISQHGFSGILERFITTTNTHVKTINIVVASPGIQFAFEIAHYAAGLSCRLSTQFDRRRRQTALGFPFGNTPLC